jgi:hypothetical protein
MSILIFLLLIELLGVQALSIWLKPRSFHLAEVLGYGFGLGAALTTLTLWLTAWSGFELSSRLILAVPLALLVLQAIIQRQRVVAFWRSLLTQTWIAVRGRYGILSTLCVLAILVVVLGRFDRALGYNFDIFDEFSFWGTAAKTIFDTRSVFMHELVLSNLEYYPLHVPILSGSLNILHGEFLDSLARFISPLYFSSILLITFGWLRRAGLSGLLALISVLFLATCGPRMSESGGILYPEIFQAYYFFAAAGFMWSWVRQRTNVRLLYAASFWLSLGAWIKVDGLHLAIVSFAVLAFCLWIWKAILRLSVLLTALAWFVPVPLLWKLFRITSETAAPTIVYDPLIATLKYRVAHAGTIFKAMLSQQFGFIEWSVIWHISGFAVLVAWFRRKTQPDVFFLALLLLVHAAFLAGLYFIVFSNVEALRAASYTRYLARLAPLATIVIALTFFKKPSSVAPTTSLKSATGANV